MSRIRPVTKISLLPKEDRKTFCPMWRIRPFTKRRLKHSVQCHVFAQLSPGRAPNHKYPVNTTHCSRYVYKCYTAVYGPAVNVAWEGNLSVPLWTRVPYVRHPWPSHCTNCAISANTPSKHAFSGTLVSSSPVGAVPTVRSAYRLQLGSVCNKANNYLLSPVSGPTAVPTTPAL